MKTIKLELREKWEKMKKDAAPEWKNYHWQAKNRITTVEQLSKVVNLTDAQKTEIADAMKNGRKMSIFPEYALLIDENKPLEDPIGKVIIPNKEFLAVEHGELLDPYALHNTNYNIYVNDESGITHKYPHVVRFALLNHCIYSCQYCYEGGRVFGFEGKIQSNPLKKRLDDVIEYTKNHPEINEMVLTGGEPLMLHDDQLKFVFERLSEVENLKVLRFCTSSVMKSPSRISEELLSVLDSFGDRFTISMVLHITHPKEITDKTKEVIKELLKRGVRCFAQIPLLRGVNIFDDVEQSRQFIREFLRKLISARIQPYYFVVKMAMPGTKHLAMPLEKIQNIFTPLLQHDDGASGMMLTFKLMAPTPKRKVFIYPETKFEYKKEQGGYIIYADGEEFFYPYEDFSAKE